ncbi:MAG TPA: PQQ-dependent sugar dehydrogenase, partial [Mycobacterium sp.]|nr:PQQ-dependent sugar dehydrogenase [Mycobacterium sp.]
MRIGITRAAVALASTLILIVACANDESRSQPNVPGVSDLATGLDVPWGIAFLSDGSALIAERNSGTVKHMTAAGAVNPVGTVAGVAARGEGGLL